MKDDTRQPVKNQRGVTGMIIATPPLDLRLKEALIALDVCSHRLDRMGS